MAEKPSLSGAYALRSADETKALYADWAESYDRSFAEDMGYALPRHVVEAFARAGGMAPVLDLGAGTGLCGEGLAARGITPVDATDLSAEMLRQAEAKGVYRRCFAADMTARLPVEEGAYAGAVCSGTFTHGHVGPAALHEVRRILSPGGLAAISVNKEHWRALGFEEALAAPGTGFAILGCDARPIYGAGASGEHAGDLAFILTLRAV